MGKSMHPRTSHDFYLPARDQCVHLRWSPPHRSLQDRLRSTFRQLMIGGPDPANPADQVDGHEFDKAFALLERDDVAGAEDAFSALGYEVTVREFQTQAIVEA